MARGIRSTALMAHCTAANSALARTSSHPPTLTEITKPTLPSIDHLRATGTSSEVPTTRSRTKYSGSRKISPHLETLTVTANQTCPSFAHRPVPGTAPTALTGRSLRFHSERMETGRPRPRSDTDPLGTIATESGQ